MAQKFKYKLSNGGELELEGDTMPSDSEVESIAKEQGVSLLPADSEIKPKSIETPKPIQPKINEIAQSIVPKSKMESVYGMKPYYGPKTEQFLSTPLAPEMNQPETWWGGFGKGLYDEFVRPMTTPRNLAVTALTGKTGTKLLKGALPEVAESTILGQAHEMNVNPLTGKPRVSTSGNIVSGEMTVDQAKDIIKKYALTHKLPNMAPGTETEYAAVFKDIMEGKPSPTRVDPNFNQGMGDAELAGSVPYKTATTESTRNPNLPKVSVKEGKWELTPGNTPEQKLQFGITRAKPAIEEQALTRTKELGEKIKGASEVTTTGRAGFYARKAAMKGEHTKVQLPPLSDVMSESESDKLFDMINMSKGDKFAKQSAADGLDKLLKGETPQASETKLLEKILGTHVDIPEHTIDKMKVAKLASTGESNLTPDDVMRRIGEDETKTGKPSKLREIYDLTRGLTSVDLPFITSAAFRQAQPLVGTRNWFKAWGSAARAYGSENTYQGILNKIDEHPLFQKIPSTTGGQPLPSLAQRWGLKMTDLNSFTNREEQIRSQLAERIPLYGRHVRASNRAFTAFTNSLRADQLDTLVKGAEAIGRDPRTDMALGKQIAEVINDTTGRGKLATKIPFTGGKEVNLEQNAKLLTDALFSPRLIARNIRMLNPTTYSQADPFVRQEYIKSMLRSVGAWGSLAALGKMAGADVSLNPTSADFGKIKIGNTRLDPGAGLQQFLVLGMRNLPESMGGGGSTSSTTGKFNPFGQGYKANTRFSNNLEFGLNKLHPTAKLAVDMMRAASDRPFNVLDRTVQSVLPMFASDLMQIANDNPDLKMMILGGLAGNIGLGSQTYSSGDYNKPTFVPPQYDIQMR